MVRVFISSSAGCSYLPRQAIFPRQPEQPPSLRQCPVFFRFFVTANTPRAFSLRTSVLAIVAVGRRPKGSRKDNDREPTDSSAIPLARMIPSLGSHACWRQKKHNDALLRHGGKPPCRSRAGPALGARCRQPERLKTDYAACHRRQHGPMGIVSCCGVEDNGARGLLLPTSGVPFGWRLIRYESCLRSRPTRTTPSRSWRTGPRSGGRDCADPLSRGCEVVCSCCSFFSFLFSMGPFGFGFLLFFFFRPILVQNLSCALMSSLSYPSSRPPPPLPLAS